PPRVNWVMMTSPSRMTVRLLNVGVMMTVSLAFGILPSSQLDVSAIKKYVTMISIFFWCIVDIGDIRCYQRFQITDLSAVRKDSRHCPRKFIIPKNSLQICLILYLTKHHSFQSNELRHSEQHTISQGINVSEERAASLGKRKTIECQSVTNVSE